jgi:hypothetical protein
MCGHHSADLVIAGVFAGAALAVVVFDIVVGTRSFFSWTKKRGFQSLKALGGRYGDFRLLWLVSPMESAQPGLS